MELNANPSIRAMYESLRIQFGDKALLDLDDYCALFKLGRRKASVHVHEHNVPHIVIGRTIYIPIHDLALYLARKKAKQDGKVLVSPKTSQDMKNRRGFRKKAMQTELIDGRV